jgi:hypothetical protein
MSAEQQPEIVLGKDLRVGDTIGVWWQARRDTITELVPYRGKLDLPAGTMLATFAVFKTGMTIIGTEDFDVFSRGPEKK